MTTTYTPAMGERLTELLRTWKLTTAAAELVARMTAGGHDGALVLLAEVFELEAQARGERRVDRRRRINQPANKVISDAAAIV